VRWFNAHIEEVKKMIAAYNVTFCGFDGGKQKVFITGKRQFKNNQQMKEFRKKEGCGSMSRPHSGILSESEIKERMVLNPEKL
jgi:hypothetical protein